MRAVTLCIALAALGSAPSAGAQNTVAIPSFIEETSSAGIDSAYMGEWEYMAGGGIATFDCNDDGFDDMFLAGGTSPAKFYVSASANVYLPSRLIGSAMTNSATTHPARYPIEYRNPS